MRAHSFIEGTTRLVSLDETASTTDLDAGVDGRAHEGLGNEEVDRHVSVEGKLEPLGGEKRLFTEALDVAH